MKWFTSSVLFAAVAMTVAPAALSQQTRLVGRVDQDAGGFFVAGSIVRLQGAAASLAGLVGEVADMNGTNVGTTAAPVIQVATIEESEERLKVDGDLRIGGELELRIDTEIGNVYYAIVAAQPGFLPVNQFGPHLMGVYMLDLATSVTLRRGPISSRWRESFALPNVPSLVGVKFWVQGAVTTPTGQALYLNPECVVIGA